MEEDLGKGVGKKERHVADSQAVSPVSAHCSQVAAPKSRDAELAQKVSISRSSASSCLTRNPSRPVRGLDKAQQALWSMATTFFSFILHEFSAESGMHEGVWPMHV